MTSAGWGGSFAASINEYVTALAIPCGYEPMGIIPMYVNISFAEELDRSARAVQRYSSTGGPPPAATRGDWTQLFEAFAECRLRPLAELTLEGLVDSLQYLGWKSKRRIVPFAGSDDDDFDIRSTVVFPVERFYQPGNRGAGRHVRLGSVELKGSGRNPCSIRRDWGHSWGGLDLGEAIIEPTLSGRVDAIAPLGAVPNLFTSFVQAHGEPAVLRQSSVREGEEFIILGTVCRAAGYTRLANIYDGPNAPPFGGPSLPSMDDVLDQYAALTAYGHFHMAPLLDNLTLEGVLLDLPSMFTITRDPGPRLSLTVLRKDTDLLVEGQVLSPEQLRSLTKEAMLVDSTTSGAHLLALQEIARFRTKLGLEGLRNGWQERYLERIAFFWLLSQGFSPHFASEHSVQLRESFRSQFDSQADPRGSYLDEHVFTLVSKNINGNLIELDIKQAVHHEEDSRRSFLAEHRGQLSALLRKHNAQAGIMQKDWVPTREELLAPPLDVFYSCNHRLNEMIARRRCWQPLSKERRRLPAVLETTGECWFLRSTRIRNLLDFSGSSLHTVTCEIVVERPDSETLETITVPARVAEGEDSIEFVVERTPFLLISATVLLDQGHRMCLPLPPISSEESTIGSPWS